MTEHQAEFSAEQGASSPELSFSLPGIPVHEVERTLNEVSLRTQEAGDFELGLSALDELWRRGVPSTMWRRYASVASLDMEVFDNASNAAAVKARYGALVAEAASASVRFLDDHVAFLNEYIGRNPGALIRDPTTEISLQRLEGTWFDDGLSDIPEHPPYTIKAVWSDGVLEPVGAGEIYVAVDKTPQEIQDTIRSLTDVY